MTAQPEFSRRLPISRIMTAAARGPVVETIEATQAELQALAKRLSLPAIQSLTCRFRLTPGDGERILAEGWLAAKVTQLCVVTNDPFDDAVAENFTVRFVPSERFDEAAPVDLDELDELPYEGNAIDLGETTTEQLALALPAFPRRPGAMLENAVDVVPAEAAEESEMPKNPFAALSHLRQSKN